MTSPSHLIELFDHIIELEFELKSCLADCILCSIV
jgi:hypothetical protein